VSASISPDISTKTIMHMVDFTSRKLLAVDGLPKGQKCKQDDFVQNLVPDLQSERSRFARQKTLVEFAAHGQVNV
jgi:hypothetical protein